MADESEQRAERDVTATTASYGGPVSDEELADVYLPEGQDEVKDTGSALQPAGGGGAGSPEGTRSPDDAPEEPAIEPPD